jgi:hypothetical protein
MRYQPDSLRWGGIASAGGAVASLALVALGLVRARRGVGTPA